MGSKSPMFISHSAGAQHDHNRPLTVNRGRLGTWRQSEPQGPAMAGLGFRFPVASVSGHPALRPPKAQPFTPPRRHWMANLSLGSSERQLLLLEA